MDGVPLRHEIELELARWAPSPSVVAEEGCGRLWAPCSKAFATEGTRWLFMLKASGTNRTTYFKGIVEAHVVHLSQETKLALWGSIIARIEYGRGGSWLT